MKGITAEHQIFECNLSNSWCWWHETASYFINILFQYILKAIGTHNTGNGALCGISWLVAHAVHCQCQAAAICLVV